jgi:hypothetical protein
MEGGQRRPGGRALRRNRLSVVGEEGDLSRQCCLRRGELEEGDRRKEEESPERREERRRVSEERRCRP